MIDMENEAWSRLIFALEAISDHLSVIRLIMEDEE